MPPNRGWRERDHNFATRSATTDIDEKRGVYLAQFQEKDANIKQANKKLRADSNHYVEALRQNMQSDQDQSDRVPKKATASVQSGARSHAQPFAAQWNRKPRWRLSTGYL